MVFLIRYTIFMLTNYHIGTHEIVYDFKELEDAIDIHKNGLRYFIFCNDPLTGFNGLINTLSLFMGGMGSNKWLPIFGSAVPSYMRDSNIEFLETVMQTKF